MRARQLFASLIALALAAVPLLADEAGTAAELDRLRHSPLELRRFVEAMPKGGDLHNHLSGATYAESFMAWAAADGLCVDKTTYFVVRTPCDASTPNLVPASSVFTNSFLYQHVLDTMSMRQFRPVAESGHDHFFRTFGAFGAVSSAHVGDMLKEVVSRFAAENVDYVETTLGPDRGAAGQLGMKLPRGLSFADMRKALLADPDFAGVVAGARKLLDDAEATLGALRCGTPEQERCSTVRYIAEVHRGGPREAVFAEMLVGFELGTADPRVVAVNPVAPEDGYVAMRDFEEQMRMFAYLRPLYPKVHLTTHAGELAPGLVPPEGLRYHIRDSIAVAGAERIGHGVDVMRETNAPELLRSMAAKPVAVEVCLTSNDVILGVRGKDHPMRNYLAAGVPVVLATDDPGVSRGDLSTELQRAVEEQGATYAELKQFARNSLQYSFLEGASLFADRTYRAFAAPCASDAPGKPLSSACHAFLVQNAKAMRQWRLEERLRAFEDAR
jgi:adenosine deaminase